LPLIGYLSWDFGLFEVLPMFESPLSILASDFVKLNASQYTVIALTTIFHHLSTMSRGGIFKQCHIYGDDEIILGPPYLTKKF
jgi:hypothetical protein